MPDNPDDVDLTNEPVSPQPLSVVSLQTYDPARDRERMRGKIAWSLVIILGAVILANIVLAFLHCPKDETYRNPLEDVLTPMVGLVGAVTGFYFGEKGK